MNERPELGEGSDNWKNRGPVDQQPPGKRLAAVSQPPATKACVQARTLRNLSFVASLLRWFWVAAALRFIAAYSHEGIRVDDVAKHVRATVRSLERHVRAATGRTMTEEIARLRMERAKRLLVESDVAAENRPSFVGPGQAAGNAGVAHTTQGQPDGCRIRFSGNFLGGRKELDLPNDASPYYYDLDSSTRRCRKSHT